MNSCGDHGIAATTPTSSQEQKSCQIGGLLRQRVGSRPKSRALQRYFSAVRSSNKRLPSERGTWRNIDGLQFKGRITPTARNRAEGVEYATPKK
ncbi:hypothetical protein NXT3_PB00138 (plasmid) [Sinorhizobium fredii]|uniref:Uncharacterized protein n=1 Tax=Rhizobium fredii TaxID=380 RepID=A0A2L0HDH6_RHIFR|nr:hypothetical protein NXT3_PB00138 [Sinorhizobium fredii]